MNFKFPVLYKTIRTIYISSIYKQTELSQFSCYPSDNGLIVKNFNGTTCHFLNTSFAMYHK